MLRVLLVTSDREVNEIVSVGYRKKGGYEGRTAANEREVSEVLRHWRPDVVVLDMVLAECTCLEVLETIRTLGLNFKLAPTTGEEKGWLTIVRSKGGLVPVLLVTRERWMGNPAYEGLRTVAEKLGATRVYTLSRDLCSFTEAIRAASVGEPVNIRETGKVIEFAVRGARVRKALERHNGAMGDAASELLTGRSNVYRWEKSHGVNSDGSELRETLELAHVGSTERTSREASCEFRVLVADDLELKRQEIKMRFKGSRCEIDLAQDGMEALELFCINEYDCVLTDKKMPKMDGMELIEEIRKRGSKVPIVLLSGFANVRNAVAAMKRGANHVYQYEEEELGDVVRHVEELAEEFTRERQACKLLEGK